MLKWLLKWIKKYLKFFFKKKQTRSVYRVEEQKMTPPPALTNADLEFLFTQLLEGVHQGRGQQWAIKYLQRMEKRISNDRWIDWLLDFGERLLKSPAPNNQLAEQMVQLGELGIGKVGDLSYDIGIRLLTRNLDNSYWESDQTQDTQTITDTTLRTQLEQGLTRNKSIEDSDNIPAAMPAPFLNPPQEEYSNNQEQFIWQFDQPGVDLLIPESAWTSSDEQKEEESYYYYGVEQSVQAGSESPTTQDFSDLQSPIAVRLDELLVRLEQSTSLVEELASGLGSQSEASINTTLPINQQKTTLEQAEAWFYEGLNQAKTGDLSGAIVSYNKAIEIHPHSQEYWFNRGLTLFYLGEFSEAIASYDEAIALKPDFYKCWYYRGGALGELGHFEDAILCFDKAIDIRFNYPEAWSGRGIALQRLGRPSEAVASYDKAIILQPQDQDNWYYRGLALAQDGRNNDAIASYEKALEIQNDFHLAWYKRGVELSDLGEFEDAIASLEQATEIQSDFSEAWYALAGALEKVGKHEDAIASYEQAAQINPNSHEVWIDKGVVQFSLGRWDDAISSWEKALEIKPDYYLGWFNCAVALDNLGQREEAIACYDKAIEFYPQFELAWYNRAMLLFYLQRFEEAIASYDSALQIKPEYWEAWIARGNAAESVVYRNNSHLNSAQVYEQGLEEKLTSYEQGLKYVDQNTQPEGWGRLHLALGNAYYDQGKRRSTPSYYWQQAVTAYNQALHTLTPEPFALLHLEVLQNLIKTLVALGQTSQAQDFHLYGTDFIQFLLSETTQSDEEKKQLALKFAGFEQLAVDIAVQSGEIAQAIEIAERGKNACLTWLLYGWTDQIKPLSYQSIQQLLNPTTAIIYWHLSPCALHTFIIKYKSPEPILIFKPVLDRVIDEVPLPEMVQRLVEFEDWLKDWNQQYKEYQQLQINDPSDKSVHPWQAEMDRWLLNLKQILNISTIVNELEDITNLILIPHRDLHRFPLHALFNLSSVWQEESSKQNNYTYTYLPSIQIGFSFKSQQLLQVQNQSLLIVEPQKSINYSTPQFTELESEAISQMFTYCRRIQGLQATKKQVENALSENYNIFHFTGYVTDNLNQPHKSEFLLAGEYKLTLEEICKKPIASYNLITLSTCETTMTSNQNITTEYVGIVTAFLSQRVNHVLSTVWTVESAATTLVMIEFYLRLQQNKSAAKALAETTAWLKELTAGELKQWYEELLNQLPQEGQKIRASLATELHRSREMSAETKLYNHPYYWAAFKIAGKFSF
ncbi:tetratricopeptide repeat protein [Brasilonema sp. CT11]|nr:tetratricopeptide repeat protein [Brasilonema sp. CT11]